MNEASWYRWRDDTLILEVRLQPRASKNEVIGPQGDKLKIRITSPPVDGKANAQLVEFLATLFKVPKSHVSLLAGETGREKRVGVRAPKHLPPFLPK